jgi:PAS domain S-box-containing protein
MDQTQRWTRTPPSAATAEALRAELDHVRICSEAAIARRENELVRLRAEIACLEIIKYRFEAIVDNVPNWLFACSPAGKVVFMNSGFTRFTGEPPEAALGDGWLSFVHPDDAQPVRRALAEAMTTGISRGVTMRVRSKTGEYRQHLATGSAVRDGNGRIVEWYGSLVPVDGSHGSN